MTTGKASRKARHKGQMFPLIESYEKYPGTTLEFCQEHNLPKSTFSYWRGRYLKSKSDVRPRPTKFIPLHLNGNPADSGYHTEISYSDGTRLRFNGSVDEHLLFRLIPSLAR